VGSNICITLSTQVRQWEGGASGWPCVTNRDPAWDEVQTEVIGYEGDTPDSDWELCYTIAHRPRIVRVFEENQQFEGTNQKKRTIESAD